MDHRSPKTWLRSITVAVAVTVWPSISVAQSVVAYRDGDGQWRWMESCSHAGVSLKKPRPPTKQSAARSRLNL